MRSPERQRSLRSRVALASGIVAALVGLVSAGAAAFLIGQLETSAQDQRLTDSLNTMARIAASTNPASPASLYHTVESESDEVAPNGLHLALFENGEWKAGADDVVLPPALGCSTRVQAGRWRTCTQGTTARLLVVSTHREGDVNPWIPFLAITAAALLAAALSALVSRTLAGWALAPLIALGERIEKIADLAPGEADLGASSGTAEVEALRETIRGLVGRLGAAIERSNGFAASAAHELRTPLATMMMELDLAAEESPAAADSLVRVKRTVGRLSVLVERLLMSATGSGNALMKDAVAIEDVVREAIAARPPNDRDRLVAASGASGMVRGDEALLRIVVDNLVDNALKFAKTGPIEITVVEDDGHVELRVRDEGPGIGVEEAEQLLQAFTRGASAKEQNIAGHGLGLSIVAHAVRLHGGDVRFVTPRSGGAELLVTLPAWSS